MSIKLILADSHKLFLDTLGHFLEIQKDINVVGMATDGLDVLKLVESLKPDVVVMDVGMPGMNGIEVTRRLFAHHPEIKVIVMSALANNHVLELLEAGVSAYIVKENDISELLCALYEVIKGKKHLCHEAIEAAVNYSGKSHHENFKEVSSREREVLQLLAEGGTSALIAKRMSISTATVDVHRRNIMKKLDLHSIAELTKYAVRHGLTAI